MSTDTPAERALIRWRRMWERESCEPPLRENGQMPSELHMWRVAGRLMRARKINTKLPG